MITGGCSCRGLGDTPSLGIGSCPFPMPVTPAHPLQEGCIWAHLALNQGRLQGAGLQVEVGVGSGRNMSGPEQ